MRFRSITIKSQAAQLVAAGIVVLLIVVLALFKPSAWVCFAVVWLIPVGLGVVNLALPDSLFNQQSENS